VSILTATEALYFMGATVYAPVAFLVVLYTCIVVILRVLLRSHTIIGIHFYASHVLFSIVGLIWGTAFLVSIDAGVITKTILLGTIPLLVLSLPFGVLQMIEQFDVLCRARWSRPRAVQARTTPGVGPRVSIHVPVYAEPPHIVKSTLDAINDLRYENFEVIVVDNNTKDESLWRPVEAYCRSLGPRFRFFHVDPLSGAKAGALNFALKHTDAAAEIVGVIDSDYHPHPDFIADLIGHFEDPQIGFVQTPHDYREWSDNTFLTMCYWEYKAFFHTILVALNEHDAALTIGTMCLLRKQAIVDAGGWATWCLTEDSEFAIRLHDAGYSSVYVPLSYGKGLIPDTFDGYSKQRRRWVSGPIQELKYHFSRFVFARGDSRLSIPQRLHHFHHGWGSVRIGLSIPLLGALLLLSLSMLVQQEVIAVPHSLWVYVTVQFVSSIVLQFLHYTAVLRCSLRETVLGYLANKALNFSAHTAALETLLNRPQPWKRTSKFRESQSVLGSLSTTRFEIAAGSMLLGVAIAMYAIMPVPGLLTMCLIGIAYRGIDYLVAPAVAVVAARSQQRIAQHSKCVDTSPVSVS
jgi:cellulose synthase/poly-beta-1,6-N-acetylglucosamine synthase-like glycosyltransferase